MSLTLKLFCMLPFENFIVVGASLTWQLKHFLGSLSDFWPYIPSLFVVLAN